jgi:hypothetical protein
LTEILEVLAFVRICSSLLLCLAVTACNTVVTEPSPPSLDSVKHSLYLDEYRADFGVVRLPESCAWQAFAATEPAWIGNVLVVLEETRPDTVSLQPVMSYLTPQEAEQLSYLLRTGASECAELGEKTGEGQGTVIEPSIRDEIPSIRLKKVALSELLDTMLGAIGLDYEVRPGFVWISRPDVLAGEVSVPPDVLAAVEPPQGQSRAELVEEIKKTLKTPVGADFEAGAPISDVLDYISKFYDLKLALDERVMLPEDPPGAVSSAKHELYLHEHQILGGKVIMLRDNCYWEAFPKAPWRGKEHVLLMLCVPRSESRGTAAVASFLTPSEAADLSEQLEKAATE